MILMMILVGYEKKKGLLDYFSNCYYLVLRLEVFFNMGGGFFF